MTRTTPTLSQIKVTTDTDFNNHKIINLQAGQAAGDAVVVSQLDALRATATPQTLGTAAVGTAQSLARADHVHAMPSAADVGAIPAGEKAQAGGVATLGGDGKIPSPQLPAMVLGGVAYQGIWDADTNVPAIPPAADTNKGWYYKVAVAGTTTVNGLSDWQVGDWVVSNGTTWDKIDNTDLVSSVFGRTGAVTAQDGDYAAGQLVFDITGTALTATRVQGAIAELDGKAVAKTLPDGWTYYGIGSVATPVRRVRLEAPSDGGDHVAYTLQHTPLTGTEEGFLNGLLQEPGASNDYTIDGVTITFTSPNSAEDKVRFSYLTTAPAV